jgi:putative membrane protein
MLAEAYLWYKWGHIISLVAWMAALFYLPRLYVYHVDAPVGSVMDQTFQTMERRLLRIIANPAMGLTFLFGLLLAHEAGSHAQGWFHAKMLLVVALAGFHGACAVWRKKFAAGSNRQSARFYRIANEVPTILLLGIVFLAVFKPF